MNQKKHLYFQKNGRADEKKKRIEQLTAFARLLPVNCSPVQMLCFERQLKTGAGGIRTPVTRKGKTVFKTVAFSRSATAPSIALLYIYRAALARGTGIYDL